MKVLIDGKNLLVIFNFVIVPTALFLVCGALSAAVPEDDVRFLKGLKSSLNDPLERLSSWNFDNTSAGFICKFVGVACWDKRENRIISLELRNMKLSGTAPAESLKYCGSMQTLDLSLNNLSGTIPQETCNWLPFLVTLDLSNNGLYGSIPPELAKCQYLNSLMLSDNKLSGTIPYELSTLGRLNKFSVKNNDLSGRLPSSFDRFDEESFAGNDGLCGGSLGKCGGQSKKNLAIIISAGVAGAAGSLLLSFGVWWCHLRLSRRRKIRYGINGRDDVT
ncbi:inactive LRR receptor-like serine/threonine-protein kinase BIR2 [Corylus avellana]|uniref:inactive LRR receptor-like serine/threonine-protein kinase BIR2 n=1 Tax=Corylus avellana TaxID=13451 RepID=UPI001E234C08|nr:inactive LRR receptor-like serine/threonine-protein kinase BIR2 [Corylus avellana]